MTRTTLRRIFNAQTGRIEVATLRFVIKDGKVSPPKLSDKDSRFLTEDLAGVIKLGESLFQSFEFENSKWSFTVTWVNPNPGAVDREWAELIEIKLKVEYSQASSSSVIKFLFPLAEDKLAGALEGFDPFSGDTPPAPGMVAKVNIATHNVMHLDLEIARQDSWHYKIRTYLLQLAERSFALANQPIEDSESEE